MNLEEFCPKTNVTILMTVRNEASFLETTLNSLIQQSYTDFTLLISNNHSTDGTKNIISKYAAIDPRIIAIEPPQSLTSTEHFKFLQPWIKTKYCMFAAGHDIYDKDYLLKLVREMEANPRLILVSSECLHFNNQNKVFPISSLYCDSEGLGKLERLSIYLLGTTYNQWGYGLFRTELSLGVEIENVPGYDHVILAHHLMRGDFKIVREVLIYFRYPENTANPKLQIQKHGMPDGLEGWRRLMEELLKLINQNFTDHEQHYAKKMVKCIYLTHYLYMTNQLGISVAQATDIANEVFGE